MKKLKKLKPIHKILILILIAISLTTLFIYSWYSKNSQWDNVNFNNKLADIPSEFVSDNRSLELEHDLDEFKKFNENYRNNFSFCDITVIFYKFRKFFNYNWKMDRIFYDSNYGNFYSYSFGANRKIFKKEK